MICVRNAELCDAGILILCLSVMCSFSCWLVIQSLGVSATCSIFWALQSMWIKHMFQLFCFTTWWTTRHSSGVLLLFLFVSGANPKKPSAPDMFTESDDMFAADFDVSIFSWGNLKVKFCSTCEHYSCDFPLHFSICVIFTGFLWSSILVLFLQSARMRAAGVGKDFKENPNLRDNWTDAEGYYRKFCLPNPYIYSDWRYLEACLWHGLSVSVETLINACLMSWQCTITTLYK